MSKATARKIASTMSKNRGRFVYPTYKGEQWTSDTFMAIRGEYEPTNKGVMVVRDSNPELDKLSAVPPLARKAKVSEIDELGNRTLTTKVTSTKVQARYHDAIMAHYPTARPKVGDVPMTAVKYVVDKQLVALVMPLKG